MPSSAALEPGAGASRRRPPARRARRPRAATRSGERAKPRTAWPSRRRRGDERGADVAGHAGDEDVHGLRGYGGAPRLDEKRGGCGVPVPLAGRNRRVSRLFAGTHTRSVRFAGSRRCTPLRRIRFAPGTSCDGVVNGERRVPGKKVAKVSCEDCFFKRNMLCALELRRAVPDLPARPSGRACARRSRCASCSARSAAARSPGRCLARRSRPRCTPSDAAPRAAIHSRRACRSARGRGSRRRRRARRGRRSARPARDRVGRARAARRSSSPRPWARTRP